MRLVWLRRDLRVDDNSALEAAIAYGEPVVAIYIATPTQWRSHNMAPIQADLIFRRLHELKLELKQCHVSLLYQEVARFDDSVDCIIQLVKRLPIRGIYFNKEYESNEVNRDRRLVSLAQSLSVDVVALDDKCIQPPGTILNLQGESYKVFTPFKNKWLSTLMVPTIRKMPAAPPYELPSEWRDWEFNTHTSLFTYPRLSSEAWPVSFDDVRAKLRQFCQQPVNHYHVSRDFPFQDGTSGLSPYLALGILSPRQCVARLMADAEHGAISDGAQVWLNELVWREFYQHLLYFRPDISKGKPFHSWGEHLIWKDEPDAFIRWQQGKTGYPIIDAAMRQLNTTGWMHNRLRMLVASFLTKDLHISWRKGESYFMSKLIDGDYAANNGGWQWCASTGCDGQPYFRIFNPVSQGEKFDKEGKFVRFWVPELKNVPDKYIHQPWHWTNGGRLSYPEPIVNHKAEREITLSIYKNAKDR